MHWNKNREHISCSLFFCPCESSYPFSRYMRRRSSGKSVTYLRTMHAVTVSSSLKWVSQKLCLTTHGDLQELLYLIHTSSYELLVRIQILGSLWTMYITLYATWGQLLAFDFTAVLVMNDSDSGRIDEKLVYVYHIAFIYE